jgi:hypothetical protein
MAVDKKSQHVGNHGGAYTDGDGMRKQFTIVDHDKKSTMYNTPDKLDKNWQKKYRASLVERIVSISASICPEVFTDFTLRGEDKTTIEWNMDMLVDNGIPIDQLSTLCTLLENSKGMRK